MSTEDQKPLTMASRPQKSLEWLDRAWSANWALRLVCVVLFLDMAMMLRTDRGLWQWSPGDMTLLSDVGWMAFVIVIFSLAVAIVIPAVLIVFRQIGAYLVYWLCRLSQLSGPVSLPTSVRWGMCLRMPCEMVSSFFTPDADRGCSAELHQTGNPAP